MFTTNHFIWLAICACFIGALMTISLVFKFSTKTSIYVMLGISIISEVVKTFIHMIDSNGGMVLDPKSLPLHLCSLLVFVIFYLAFSKNEERKQKVLNFYVPISLLAGFIALMMATSGVDFTKVISYQSFLYHAGLVWFGLWGLVTKKVNMGWKSYVRNIITLGVLVFSMLWVNSALKNYDTNFFFIVKPPLENLPILNLNHGWGVYFVIVIAIGFIAVTALHLPYMIIEAVRKHKEDKVDSQPQKEIEPILKAKKSPEKDVEEKPAKKVSKTNSKNKIEKE